MAERTARLGSMQYVDVDGRHRIASLGDVIDVHADNLERFDRLNVLAGEPDPEEPVKKPAPRPRKTRGR